MFTPSTVTPERLQQLAEWAAEDAKDTLKCFEDARDEMHKAFDVPFGRLPKNAAEMLENVDVLRQAAERAEESAKEYARQVA